MTHPATSSDYNSPPGKIGWMARVVPGLIFYRKMIFTVISAARAARRLDRNYNGRRWIEDSHRIRNNLESVGVKISVDNTKSFINLSQPCVFTGNHMSVLETFILPGIIRPYRNITFVIKDSLLTYPVFKNIMASLRPIAVSRTNPRQDLQTVLREGEKSLDNDRSVILFPQPSRDTVFNPDHFNSLGVKLARRAGVPVVPIAIKSDAWGNGRWLKDFGRISPHIPVHFSFGNPITVKGSGNAAQEEIIRFISGKLQTWREKNSETN